MADLLRIHYGLGAEITILCHISVSSMCITIVIVPRLTLGCATLHRQVEVADLCRNVGAEWKHNAITNLVFGIWASQTERRPALAAADLGKNCAITALPAPAFCNQTYRYHIKSSIKQWLLTESPFSIFLILFFITVILKTFLNLDIKVGKGVMKHLVLCRHLALHGLHNNHNTYFKDSFR